MEDYELKIFKRNEDLKKKVRGLRYEGNTQKDPVLYEMKLDTLERQIRLNDLVLWGL